MCCLCVKRYDIEFIIEIHLDIDQYATVGFGLNLANKCAAHLCLSLPIANLSKLSKIGYMTSSYRN